MKNKNIFLIAAVMLLAAICMSQTTYAQNKDFRAQAGELILKGEFKKTEKLLNGLPKKTKTENRFTIDSIQQTMYRIRKDFFAFANRRACTNRKAHGACREQ